MMGVVLVVDDLVGNTRPLEALMTERPYKAALPFAEAAADNEAQGVVTPRSLQIFFARSSLISECLGPAELLPAARFTKME